MVRMYSQNNRKWLWLQIWYSSCPRCPLLLSLGSIVINRMLKGDTPWLLRLAEENACGFFLFTGMPRHRALSPMESNYLEILCWRSHVQAFSWQPHWASNRQPSCWAATWDTQPSWAFWCLQPQPTSHCSHKRDPQAGVAQLSPPWFPDVHKIMNRIKWQFCLTKFWSLE